MERHFVCRIKQKRNAQNKQGDTMKGSSWLATAVLCGIVLILSYKLVLNKGLFIKPLKWRDPEGKAAHTQGHPSTCLRSWTWAGPQSLGEKTPGKRRLSALPFSQNSSFSEKVQTQPDHFSKNLSSQAQNWETKHMHRRSLNSQNRCCKGQTLMFMDLIHSRPLRPSLRAMTKLVVWSSVHCWSWETDYSS